MAMGFGSNDRSQRKEKKGANESPWLNTLKRAINSHNSGQTEIAERLYIQAINMGCNHEACYLNLGTIKQQKHELDAAKNYFTKTLNINPYSSKAYLNLSKLSNLEGHYEKSLELGKKSIELNPNDSEAIISLGLLYRQSGRLDDALAEMHRAIKISPNSFSAHMNIGAIYKEKGDCQKALKSTLDAIKINPKSADAKMNLGSIYIDLGKFTEALKPTENAIKLNPNLAHAFNNLGTIFIELMRYDKAIDALLEAVKINPKMSSAYASLGTAYQENNDLSMALKYINKATNLDKDNIKYKVIMVQILRNSGDIQSANLQASSALEIISPDSDYITALLHHFDISNQYEILESEINKLEKRIGNQHPKAIIFKSKLSYTRKDHDLSLKHLNSIDPALLEKEDWFCQMLYQHNKAIALDKLGKHDEAYMHFASSQMDPRYEHIDHKLQYKIIDEYTTLCKTIDVHKKANIPHNSPVFLVGFPRSGTTLLDSILRTHEEIEVIEEKDALRSTESYAIHQFRLPISHFNKLSEEDLSKLREAYFRQLNKHVSTNKHIKVDKLPLSIIKIPLIKLLFPDAKILLAIRHPCDCILSCFQQLFLPNSAMANFTTLEKSIHYYNKTMGAWIEYTSNLSIDYCLVKYESLVKDFDHTTQNLLKHIGADWDVNIRDFALTANQRAFISTPSSSQVIQPLYTSSIEKWQNYSDHFSPYMDIISPWIKHFGYDK